MTCKKPNSAPAEMLLVAPQDARRVEASARPDGSMLFKWFDINRDEMWSLTSSADRREVDVEIRYDPEGPAPSNRGVLEELRWVFQYSSGLNVNIKMLSAAA